MAAVLPFQLTQAQLTINSNDDFADALDISSTGLNYQYFYAGSTAEAGEPGHAGSPAVESVWFALTKPEDGVLRMNGLATQGGGLRMAVYTGTQVDQLHLVAEGINDFHFQIEANVQYWIAVDCAGGKIVNLYQYPNGGADEWTDATVLPAGLPQRFRGNNIFATASPTEPDYPSTAPQTDVWWKWTAPASGHITMDAIASPKGVRYYIYEQVGGDDPVRIDSSPTPVTAGNHYYFRFDEVSNGPGEIDCWLEWIPSGPPANDHVADAIDLGNGRVVCAGAWTAHATGQVGIENNFWERSVWWRWTCPEDGNYMLSALGTYGVLDTTATMTVYDGPPGPSNEVATSGQSFSFEAVQGTEYYIRVASWWPRVNFSLYPGTTVAPYFQGLAEMSYRQPARPKLRGEQRHPHLDPDGDGFTSMIEVACNAYPDLVRPEDRQNLPLLMTDTTPPQLRWYWNTNYMSEITVTAETSGTLGSPWQQVGPAESGSYRSVELPNVDGKGFARLRFQDPRLPATQ